jgi:brefeldin A-inhibited guanine nucleotide-exchange protein
MSNVFLRVLESENSSFKQKALVLESLRALCSDPVLLTQVFLNYDCDMDASNLYKDIVHMLTKLGGKATQQSGLSLSSKEQENSFELSLAAVEVLSAILKACLKALGLPAGQDEAADDTAGSKIRGMLKLDIGSAAVAASTPTRTHKSDRRASEKNGVSSEGDSERDSDDPSLVAGKIDDAFQAKRTAEDNFETGAMKFTMNLKSGLNYFIENGFVELDANQIALFFLANKDKLDKTQMGEVMGREPDGAFVKGKGVDVEKGGNGFFVRILHHYVEALDFSGLMFDDAIRLFLSGFRLPGEAQKIDRIMEKFAQRYIAQNLDVFPSADTAFILAFSVIMLNTDLHNPSIKEDRRMTVESFIRNNRGIGENGSDLPEKVLVGIFNRIKERPFSLKEDDAARERAAPQKSMLESSVFFEGGNLFGSKGDERKREKFKKEKDEIMEATQQLIRRRTQKQQSSVTASKFTEGIDPADVVKPMFHDTWGPIIGILSQILECSEDERSVAVCLNAFIYAVRISCHCDMSLARDTFMTSLAKFTFLGSLKEMKRKNVDSIRTILSIAIVDGEYLGDSWGSVLQCMSQVSRLRLSASGLDSDETFLKATESSKDASVPAKSLGYFQSAQPSKKDISKVTTENNGSLVLEAVQEVLIDKVFSSTVNLTASSLVQFIAQLIAVSTLEIEGKSTSTSTASISGIHLHRGKLDVPTTGDGPSVFSLLKLVEVAAYNMDVRPRLVWAQIWEMMADHLSEVACSSNVKVAAFAIDAMKQLSSKFLEKPELSDFNFQRIFLGPFLTVMQDDDSSEEIREMVLNCIDNIIGTKSKNLRSGWKVVFTILKRAAVDPSEKIDYLGLTILQRLLDNHLHEICNLTYQAEGSETEITPSHELSSLEKRDRNANAEDFVGLCRTSLAFVHQEESDSARPIGLTMRAFSHVAIYADLLAEDRIPPPASGSQVRFAIFACVRECYIFVLQILANVD